MIYNSDYQRALTYHDKQLLLAHLEHPCDIDTLFFTSIFHAFPGRILLCGHEGVIFTTRVGRAVEFQETLSNRFAHECRVDLELVQPLVLARVESCPEDVDALRWVLGQP